MKKFITLLLFSIVLILTSCDPNSNETLTINWIEQAKKPIIVKEFDRGDIGAVYTLFDANGKIYYTRVVCLQLPDTIK